MDEPYERGVLIRVRARIEALRGDVAAASESYREALVVHEDCSPFDLAVTRSEYANFCIENIVDLDDAARQLEMARVLPSCGEDARARSLRQTALKSARQLGMAALLP